MVLSGRTLSANIDIARVFDMVFSQPQPHEPPPKVAGFRR